MTMKNQIQRPSEDVSQFFSVAEIFIVVATPSFDIVVNGSDAEPASVVVGFKTLLEPAKLRLGAESVMPGISESIDGVIMPFVHRGIKPGNDNSHVRNFEHGPRFSGRERDGGKIAVELVKRLLELLPLRKPGKHGIRFVRLTFAEIARTLFSIDVVISPKG